MASLYIQTWNLQFYRVEVKILPPEGKGVPKSRVVLRRYNHFHKLHAKVSSIIRSHQSQSHMLLLPEHSSQTACLELHILVWASTTFATNTTAQQAMSHTSE